MFFTLTTKFNLRQVSASIMRITYGINVKEEGDEYIAMLETAMEDFVDASLAVDIFESELQAEARQGKSNVMTDAPSV